MLKFIIKFFYLGENPSININADTYFINENSLFNYSSRKAETRRVLTNELSIIICNFFCTTIYSEKINNVSSQHCFSISLNEADLEEELINKE